MGFVEIEVGAVLLLQGHDAGKPDDRPLQRVDALNHDQDLGPLAGAAIPLAALVQ